MGFPGPLSPPPNMCRPSGSSWTAAAAAAAHQQQLAAAVAASTAMNFPTPPLSLHQAVAAAAAQQQQHQLQLQHAALAAAALPPALKQHKHQQKRQLATNATKPRRSQPQKNAGSEDAATAAPVAGAGAPQQLAKASISGKTEQHPQADTQLLLERIHQQQIQLQQQQLQLEQLQQQQQRQSEATAKGAARQMRERLAPSKGGKPLRAPRA